MSTDAAYTLAQHVADTSADDLPEGTRRQTQRFLLDTLAVAAAGSRAFGMAEALAVIAAQGGAPEATVIGSDLLLPAAPAALCNGALTQAWEFDDVHDEAFLHVYAAVFPAAVGIGERLRATGRQVVAALTLGVDVACRLSRAIQGARGWYRGATCGIFGAAAAAGKLLGLDAEGIRNSFGIALSQAAGTSQASADGAASKNFQAGFAAQAGVLSALLACRGVSGARQVFQGDYGLYQLYTKQRVEAEAITAGLGEVYLGDTLSHKPYPCCRGVHGALDAALLLRRRHALTGGEIERITVTIPPTLAGLISKQVTPCDRAAIDVQFSLPYGIANALVRGEVKLQHYSPEAVGDPQVQKLAHCVTIAQHDESKQPTKPGSLVPVRLELRCGDGRAFEHTTTVLRGGPASPFSDEELRAKATSCLEFAGLPRERIERLLETVSRIEALREINQLMCLLRG